MFGNNTITRNFIKIVNHTQTIIHDRTSLNDEFVKGMISGFGTAFCYSKYLKPFFARAAPPPLTGAVEVLENVEEKVNLAWFDDIKNLLPPISVSLFNDDHFLCGTMVGAGISYITSNNFISVPLIALGIGCEAYYTDMHLWPEA
jgi:hypothetical protein